MACPVLVPLSAFSQHARSSIGSRALERTRLSALGVPLPEQFAIPRETLARIVRESHLEHSLGKLLAALQQAHAAERATILTHIQQSLEYCMLPEWFTVEIHRAYAHLFTAGFCRIVPGEHVPGYAGTQFSEIQGDSNCIESFKKAWGTVAQALIHHADRPSLATITQVPLIVEEQMQPVVSGFIRTSHTSAAAPAITLTAIWGSPDPTLFETAADTYQVDVRTWQVVHKAAVQKKHRYERTAEKLLRTAVPNKYESYPCLSDEQAVAIAQVGQSIKQKNLFHHKIQWELGSQGLWVTEVIEDEDDHTLVPSHKKTITQVYISAGNPQKRPFQGSGFDGIGVLRSEYTYFTFGVHPLHLVRAGKEAAVVHALTHTITQYQEMVPFKPVLFRSLNCTSAELTRLKYANTFENEEENPYLGLRGGLRLLADDALLQCELMALATVATRSQAALGYLLPFVRHPQELSALMLKIERSGLLAHTHVSVWLQANTPENILNIEAYPTHKLAGISVNVTSLQALLTGSDPDNPSTAEHYQSDTTALESLLSRLSASVQRLNTLRVHAPLKLNLHLESFNQELVVTAVKLGYHGIVVKSQAVQIARETVYEAERLRVVK